MSVNPTLFAFLVTLCLLLVGLCISASNYDAHNIRVSKSTNQLFISWTTKDYNEQEYLPTVWQSKNSDFSHYSQNANVQPPITKAYHNESGYTHTVVLDQSLEKLAASSLYYYYKVGNSKTKLMTDQLYQVRVSLSNKVLMYGDMGIFRSSHTIQSSYNRLKNEQDISMVYHLGDISYADDFPGSLFDGLFTHWLGLVEGITSFVPYQVLPGNHDAGCKIPLCHPWKQDFRPFNMLFTMPSYFQTKHNMFYSFDHGQIHFVSISTETDYPNAPFHQVFGDQMTWLKKDLQNAVANRKQVPWIVVVGHRPIYSSMSGYSSNGKPITESLVLQNTLEQLFKDHHVDLYMMGHVHSYERFHPVYNNTAKCDSVCTNTTNTYHNPEYPVHIVNGAGGCEEGLSPGFKYHHILPSSAKVFYEDYGYGVLDATKQHNSLVLNWKFFAATKDELVDEMTIIKSSH